MKPEIVLIVLVILGLDILKERAPFDVIGKQFFPEMADYFGCEVINGVRRRLETHLVVRKQKHDMLSLILYIVFLKAEEQS